MSSGTYDFPASFSRRKFMGALASGAALSAIPLSAQASSAARDICIFSKHLQWVELPEMIEITKQLGFTGIDLTVRPGGHIEPENVAAELPKVIKMIRKAGLKVPMVATGVIDPADPLTETILKTIGDLEIPYYRTGYLKYDAKEGVAKSLEKFKGQIGRLSDLNRKYKVHGAYQNHSGTGVGASVWDLWEIIKDLDPQWIGCQYDIKHAVAEGGLSWVNGLDALKSHIKCMDMKDFIWVSKAGKWQQEQVPLGTGMVNFPQYIQHLKKYGISGPMSLHFEYNLGGAEHGKKSISIPKDDVLFAMKRDLQVLSGLLNGE